MSTKRIVIISSICILCLISGIIIYDAVKPLEENSYFENTEKDSLNSIIEKVNEYKTIIESFDYFDSPSYDYDEHTLKSSYTRSEMDQFQKKDDIIGMYPSTYPMYSIEYILDEVNDMNLRCIGYDEGEQCKFLFERKWIELHMEGDQIYINYYRRHKNSFIQDRDEWENFEIYMNMVDNKLVMTVGFNTYNMLNNYLSEQTIYFVEGEYIEHYIRGMYGNYIYDYINYENGDYFHYNGLGSDIEITHYNSEESSFVNYNDLIEVSDFEYHYYEDSHDVFFMRYSTNTLRFDFTYVDGWDNLSRTTDDWYSIYNEGEIVTNELSVYISDYLSITPYLFVEVEDNPLTEDLVNLSRYNLVSNFELSDILEVKSYYENNISEVLEVFGLSNNYINNESYFDDKIINEDDGSLISFSTN